MVLADFPELREPEGRPTEVPIDRTRPARARVVRWSATRPEYAACLSAWERPGQEDAADGDRLFETIWTVEPELVRDASRIAAGLAARRPPSWSPR